MATISIPIETKVREFDGKLWLASILAKHGHKVAIGEKKRSLIATEIKPDFHIDGSPIYTQDYYETLSKFRNCGIKLGILDTEGGIFTSKESYFDNRISGKTLGLVDAFFAWGNEPASVVRERTNFPEQQLHVTGNPRFDLLHPELRGIYTRSADQIKVRLKQYILFNTNFTTANPYDKSKFESILSQRDIKLKDDRKVCQQQLLNRFLEAIEKLARRYTDHRIVIRPHPSENHDTYRAQLDDFPSVIVEHSGDVRSWIVGADCVIHNGCTTGIEAAMLNTPVIAYEPEITAASYPRPHLPNEVSKSVHTEEGLLDQVDTFIKCDEPYEMTSTQKDELQKYFANLEEPAAPKIVDAINEMNNLDTEKSYPELSLKRRLKLWVKQTPAAPHIQRLRELDRNRSGYRHQKFPGLTIQEVRSRLQDLEKVLGPMDLEVSRVNYLDDIYWIQK